MILIPLNYPLNLQEFFAEIFPLINFDLINFIADPLYNMMFRPSTI